MSAVNFKSLGDILVAEVVPIQEKIDANRSAIRHCSLW